ncbi:MAG TPA: hypothetical protein VGF56_02730 [Rhizomicrobium sp.]|jgi:hypothetical protein
MPKKPYRAIPLEEYIAKLPITEQLAIARRTGELLAEELSLRDLRKSVGKTQVSVAKLLKIGQDAVSKLEMREDMYLSTLRGFIEAMGGKLELVVKFPDRPAVRIDTFTRKPARRKAKRAA